MRIIDRIKNAYLWHVVYTIDKIVNTIIWLFTPKDKVLVLNVWLRHRGNKVRFANIGDDLNYAIVSFLTKKRIISYMHSYVSLFKPRNYMCIGSIADTLANSESIIWGSGAMYGDNNREIVSPKDVLAVRGPLTRNYLLSKGILCPEVYGDPALLLPLVFPCNNVKKKYKMGIIPHYVDKNSMPVVALKKIYERDIVVIDLQSYSNWNDVVHSINSCDFVVSSSLHGLIISDAYQIPNVWVRFSQKIEGGDFKFRDYYGAYGLFNCSPINMEEETSWNLNLLKRYAQVHKISGSIVEKLISTCPFS